MADEKLRILERRYRESGAVEHEAAYLLEAVRARRIGGHRLELAADLGHPAARLALGADPIGEPEIRDLGRQLRERWGQWELVRAALTLARRLVPHEEFPSAQLLVVRGGLERVQAWVKVSTPEASREVARQDRRIGQQELVAWAGEPVALALRHTFWAVTQIPARGSSRTRGYETPLHALAVLGLDGVRDALSEALVPRLFEPPSEA